MNALTLLIAISVAQAGPTGIQDNILGIKIGSTLAAARASLSPLGEGGGRDLRGNGRREAWNLAKTPFQTVTFQATGRGTIKWVSGYLRDGEEIPFESFGDLKTASSLSDDEAIWNVPTESGGYRLVAKGAHKRGKVVYLISTATNIG